MMGTIQTFIAGIERKGGPHMHTNKPWRLAMYVWEYTNFAMHHCYCKPGEPLCEASISVKALVSLAAQLTPGQLTESFT